MRPAMGSRNLIDPVALVLGIKDTHGVLSNDIQNA